MITRPVVRSRGGGSGSGSSIPSRVDYAYIVAKNKVGLDDAITGTATWSFRITMPSASTDISTSTQLVGCVSMIPGGILEASDGTNVSTLPIPGGWLAGDELLICLTIDPVAETMILWRPEL